MKKQRKQKKGKSFSKLMRKPKRRTDKRTVSMPRAKGSIFGTSNKFKEIRIRHREYVTDLVTDVDASYTRTFEVNPGLESCFPWVSRLAAGFETYVFNSLKFTFVTAMGTNNNGAIAIIPDYDAQDDNTSQTKAQLLSYADCKRGPIWYDLSMICTPKNLKKKKEFFIRAKSTTEDKKLFDACSLTILVTGLDANTNIGELWVEYDLTFLTPQLEPEPQEDFILDITDQDTAYPFNLASSVIHNTIEAKIVDANTIAVGEGKNVLISLVSTTNETMAPVDISTPTIPLSSIIKGSVTTIAKMVDTTSYKNSATWLIKAVSVGISVVAPLLINWTGITYGDYFEIGRFVLRLISDEEAADILLYAKKEQEIQERRAKLAEAKKILEKI